MPEAGPLRRGPTDRLGWALAVLILAACFLFVDPRDIVAALAKLTPLEVAGLLAIATLDRVLMGLRWALLLRILGVEVGLAWIMQVFYKASLAGMFMPAQVGGDVLRAYWLARESRAGYPVVIASLFMERLLGLLSAANLALVGLAVLAAHLAPERARLLAGLGLFAVLTGNVLFGVSLSDRVHGLALRFLGRFGPAGLGGVVHRLYAAYASFGRNRRGLSLAILLTLVEHCVQMAFLVAISFSIGIDADSIVLLAAAAVYLLLARLPLAPDGWGVSELAAIGVFGLVGVSSGDAFSLSLVGHVVPMLALLPAYVLLLPALRRQPFLRPSGRVNGREGLPLASNSGSEPRLDEGCP